MTLYKCGVCGTEIPFLKCPKCGDYRFLKRKPSKTGWMVTAAIFIIIIIVFITGILL